MEIVEYLFIHNVKRNCLWKRFLLLVLGFACYWVHWKYAKSIYCWFKSKSRGKFCCLIYQITIDISIFVCHFTSVMFLYKHWSKNSVFLYFALWKELSVKIVLFLLINILIRKRGSQNAASLCIRFSETYPLTFLLSSLRLLL